MPSSSSPANQKEEEAAPRQQQQRFTTPQPAKKKKLKLKDLQAPKSVGVTPKKQVLVGNNTTASSSSSRGPAMKLPPDFDPQNHSVWVYHEATTSGSSSKTTKTHSNKEEKKTMVANIPTQRQGVWKQKGYQVYVSPTELWMFPHDQMPGGLLEEEDGSNNSKHVHGVWGFHPDVADAREATSPSSSLSSFCRMDPDRLWFYPPHDQNQKLPKYFIPRGVWIVPQVVQSQDRIAAQLNPEEAGFLNISDRVQKSNKLDVGGSWKMLYKRDGETLPTNNNDTIGPGLSSKKKVVPPRMQVIVRDGMNHGNEFTVVIDPNDTLDELKDKIQNQEGIPKGNQRLLFGSKPLTGGSSLPQTTSTTMTLRDYGIENGSILDLAPMQVNILLPNGKVVPIHVVPMDTVQDLQEKIQDQHRIPVPEQRLEWNNKNGTKSQPSILNHDPSRSLQDLGVEHGDTIQMKPMEVIVRDVVQGREFTVVNDRSHTVGDLKRKIQDQEGIPKANQRLIFGTLPLTEDTDTLRSYGIIQHGSILDLVEPIMIVHVVVESTPDNIGKRIPVPVKPSDTIADVKRKVEEQDDGIPAKEQILNWDGKELPDTSTLQDHGIQHGDTLQLTAAGITIFIKDWKNKTTRLENVKSSDTLQMIRERLQPIKDDLAPKRQILSYNNKNKKNTTTPLLLDDNAMTLADYKIPNGATIDLDRFKIYVEVPTIGKFLMEVDPSWKLKRIKDSVNDRFKIKPDMQEAFYHGTLLPYGDDTTTATFADCGIQHKDTVVVQEKNIPEYEVKIGAWQDPFQYTPKSSSTSSSPHKKKVGVRTKTTHDRSKDFFGESERPTALSVDIWDPKD